MARFLVDENLPRSLAPHLRAAELDVLDVRDLGLRGSPDIEILDYAISRELVLLTSDLGFGSLLRSKSTFPGLVLTRLPDEWPTFEVNEVIGNALALLRSQDIANSFVVIEPRRVRVRKVWDLTAKPGRE